MSLNTAIRGVQIQDGAVDTLQLADDGVTNAKLANIAQGSIKVGGGSNAPTDLDAKTDKQILIGDGTDVVSVAVSGDITIGNTGVVAIASGVIVDDDVNAGANIAESKLNLNYATHDNSTDHTAGTDPNDHASGSESLVGDVGGTVGANTIGATKVTDAMINDDVATGLAGVGLSASSGVMAIDLNEMPTEATFDVNADFLGIVDATDNGSNKTLWSVIATAIAGTGITATNGVLSADAVADNLVEADIKFENLSADVDASGYAGVHTLSNTPITNSVQIFLNGLLQEEGSGKDYTLSGTTVTFATQPVSGDIILAHYVLND